ncbi:hypothetical protein IKE83_01985 [Candidatus Saccharibacteria bacterium]|nr:hypothetical protein [Candidatus Saccharibacteria bacterium]
MDRHNVRDAIKYGLGIAGLAEKYDCGEEAVILRLRLIYKRDFRAVLQDLRDSSKKISGIKKREGTKMDKVISESTDNKEFTTSELDLEKLRTQKAELEANVARIECDFYNTLNYREADLKILQQKALELEEISKRFAAARQEYEVLTAKDSAYVDTLRSLKYERMDAQKALADTERRLQELEVSTLFLYADGRIEIVDGPELELDFSGAETNLMKLIPMPECQKLTVSEAYGLANLLAATQNSNRKINIVFENPLAESAFTKYLGENPGKSTPSTDVVSSGDNTARQGDVA